MNQAGMLLLYVWMKKIDKIVKCLYIYSELLLRYDLHIWMREHIWYDYYSFNVHTETISGHQNTLVLFLLYS